MVAEIKELVEREEGVGLLGGGADVVLADIDLQSFAGLLEVREAGFALGAVAHDPAGDGGFDGGGFELFGGAGPAEGDELGERVREAEGVGVEGFGAAQAEAGADLGDAVELGDAIGVELGFVVGVKVGQWGSFRGGSVRDCGEVQYIGEVRAARGIIDRVFSARENPGGRTRGGAPRSGQCAPLARKCLRW